MGENGSTIAYPLLFGWLTVTLWLVNGYSAVSDDREQPCYPPFSIGIAASYCIGVLIAIAPLLVGVYILGVAPLHW